VSGLTALIRREVGILVRRTGTPSTAHDAHPLRRRRGPAPVRAVTAGRRPTTAPVPGNSKLKLRPPRIRWQVRIVQAGDDGPALRVNHGVGRPAQP